MTITTNESVTTTQVFRVFIKATPQAIWDAITKPEWAERYGYASRVEYDLRPGGAYKAFPNEPMKSHGAPDVIIVGEVIEADPPRKLVQTWHPIWDPSDRGGVDHAPDVGHRRAARRHHQAHGDPRCGRRAADRPRWWLATIPTPEADGASC